MILIDTNIFLEYLLDQKEAENCEYSIKRIIDDEIRAVVTSFSIHSIEVIMIRKDLQEPLEIFLEELIGIQYIRIHYTSIIEEREVLEEMKATGLDFDDALQLYVAKKFNAKILTLDNDFNRVKNSIKIISPESFRRKNEA